MTNNTHQTNLIITQVKPNAYEIAGELSFQSINAHSLEKINFAITAEIINLNLQQVSKIDSAGLALLIEWMKIARTKQKKLTLSSMPEKLTALASLSSLTELDLFN